MRELLTGGGEEALDAGEVEVLFAHAVLDVTRRSLGVERLGLGEGARALDSRAVTDA